MSALLSHFDQRMSFICMLFVICVSLAVISVDCRTTSENSERRAGNIQPVPSESFERSVQLDSHGNYWLFWTPNKTHVKFEINVKTHGYVGFGFSSNGKMYPGDVVVGWVKDGATFFKDCHTADHVIPVEDVSQDWQLIRGWETEQSTVLKFTRKLDTCDKNDLKITDETMRVIFSYHPDDPDSMMSLPWHGVERRGAKSVLFLSVEPIPVLPPDVKTFDFTSNNFHLPSQDTVYQCTNIRLPKLQEKNHIVKFEPVIQEGNEQVVHHMLVYSVNERHVDSRFDNISFDCSNDESFGDMPKGWSVFLIWAVGGREYYFPENTGISIGMPDDPSFFVLQIHYNNPTLLSDIVDSSGLRITYSPSLRPHDSDILFSAWPVDKRFTVPPHEQNWISKSYCLSDCLQQTLPVEGIDIYAVFQHAHLLARGIVTRHYRNGTELEPIAEDLHYDFNFQDMRALREHKKLMRGDSFDVECHYNSEKRTNATYGGYSTHDEMCETYLFYYPKIRTGSCGSFPVYEAINATSTDDAVATFIQWDWNKPSVRKRFHDVLEQSDYIYYCGNRNSTSTYQRKLPVPTTTYTPPQDHCQVDQDSVFG